MHKYYVLYLVSLYLQIALGSSVVSLVLFLAGSCFYVKKKPQRSSCRCSRNHIHTEVREIALILIKDCTVAYLFAIAFSECIGQ